jgi:hypothetical protein
VTRRGVIVAVVAFLSLAALLFVGGLWLFVDLEPDELSCAPAPVSSSSWTVPTPPPWTSTPEPGRTRYGNSLPPGGP